MPSETEAKVPGLAIFDLDGTLVRGISSERRFLAYLARNGHLGPRQWGAAAAFWLRHFPRFGFRVQRRNKAYLTGLDTAEVAEIAEAFVDRVLMAAVDPAIVARLQRHQGEGDRVLLLTGTLEAIAAPLGRRLGIADVVASRCAVDHGRYRAAMPRRHPYGRAKRELAAAWCQAAGATLASATAYADAWDDRFLLEAVDRAVAVRPDSALRRLAVARGWEVVDSRADESGFDRHAPAPERQGGAAT